jgi:G:T-mismatch repair DNA endonuclease (very short patch repair protein)
VTILHKIHYSIEVPKTKTDYWFSKYNRVLHHYSVSTEVVVAVAVVGVWVLVAVVGVMVVVAAGMIGV